MKYPTYVLLAATLLAAGLAACAKSGSSSDAGGPGSAVKAFYEAIDKRDSTGIYKSLADQDANYFRSKGMVNKIIDRKDGQHVKIDILKEENRDDNMAVVSYHLVGNDMKGVTRDTTYENYVVRENGTWKMSSFKN